MSNLCDTNPEVPDGLPTPERRPFLHPPHQAFLRSLGSAASRQTMASVIRSLAAMLRETTPDVMPWTDVCREDAQRVLVQLQDTGRSGATQALYLAALRGVLREAWLQRNYSGDELQRIAALKPYRGKRLPKGRAVDIEELDHLLIRTASDLRPRAIRDAAVIHTLYSSGLRRSELVRVDLADLVPEDAGIRVVGKGNRERIAYLDDQAWDALNTWIDAVRGDEPGPLFLPMAKNGRPIRRRMSGQAVAYLLRQRVLAADVPATLPHDLRRSFITHLLDQQVDLATVADLAGHASIETTRIYDRRGEARKKAAVGQLRNRTRVPE